MIGSVFEGKYRIVRLIGKGGMGAVYEAEHTLLGRRVAIKVLAPEFGRKADLIKRFVREAQAAARIGHENICEALDIGQTPAGLPYAVMQLLQGRSLAATLREEGPLDIGRAIDIAAQTLDALGAAHAANIVHRDVKPDNIFLTRVAGREDFVKVLDFGISKVRGVTGTSAQLTQTGAVLGTPAYMSPEQARGETDVDARTDVWATGVVVFEMLTGRVPFLGANYNHVLYQVLSAPIPSVRSLRQAVTPELEAAVLGALERDTARRHPSAAAFRKALFVASLAAGEPAAAVAAQGSGPSGQGSDQQPATKDQELPAVASGERTVAAEPTVGATAVPLRTTPGVWGRVRRHRTQIVAAGVLLLAIAVGAVLVVARGGSGGEGPGSGDEAKGGGLQGEGSGVRTQGSGIEVPAAGTVPAGEPATDRPRLTPETISPGAVGPAKAEPAETSAPPVEEHTPAPPPVTPAAPASPPPVVNHRRPADAGTAATASHGRDVATRPRDAGTGLDRAAAPPATIAAAATADAGAPPGQQPTTGGQQPRTRAGASPDTGTVSATVDGGPRVGDIPIRTTHRDAAGRVEVIPIRTTHGGDR